MQQIQEIILLSLIAGAAIPVGGFLGAISEIYPRWLNEEWRHSIIAFGGGALLSAVSLVLVPEGIRHISVIAACMAFIGGGVFFCIIDYKLSKKKGSTAQLMAMLLYFVPEAVALGAALVDGMLLAFLIAIQNLPEGFNAKVKLLLAFMALALLGPLSAFFGPPFWLIKKLF